MDHSPVLPFHLPLASSTGHPFAHQSGSSLTGHSQTPPSGLTLTPPPHLPLVSPTGHTRDRSSDLIPAPPSHPPLASPTGHSLAPVSSVLPPYQSPSGQSVDPFPDQQRSSLTLSPPHSLPLQSPATHRSGYQVPPRSSQVFQEQVLSSGEVLFTEQDTLSVHQEQPLPKQSFRTRSCHAGESSSASERSGDPTVATGSRIGQPLATNVVTSHGSFSEDFEFDWTDEDSDYLTSHSLGDSDNLCSRWYGSTPSQYHSRDASCSGSETIMSPSHQTSTRKGISHLCHK